MASLEEFLKYNGINIKDFEALILEHNGNSYSELNEDMQYRYPEEWINRAFTWSSHSARQFLRYRHPPILEQNGSSYSELGARQSKTWIDIHYAWTAYINSQGYGSTVVTWYKQLKNPITNIRRLNGSKTTITSTTV